MARYEPHDKFYRKARDKGLPSRAAFKIEELIGRVKLPRASARIVDLGCAPGGWLAILGGVAGERGRVLGVDIAPSRSFGENVETMVADIRDPEIAATIGDKLGGLADLVTSDLAPKLTGIKDRDEAQMEELIESALAVAEHTLRPGGSMIAKLFMNAAFPRIVARFKQAFAKVEITKTAATRPGSSELYVIARDFRGGTAR